MELRIEWGNGRNGGECTEIGAGLYVAVTIPTRF